MAGEHKRERSDIETGVDKGLPPITAAGDDLEKMNAVGGADDKVNSQKTKPSEEVVTVSDNDQAPKKKPRLIWTRELRNCFRDAVKQLGSSRAVPTKILELMNVEHLTRENVASHLQKFRLQNKRREEEQAQEGAASGNVAKVVYPTMSGISQQPCVQQNTMQGINKQCTGLDRSQLAPSFVNHNLNMIQGFPSIQEVYGTPFKDVGVNRMSSVRRVHGPYDSNDPYHINKFVHNYGPLPLKPLVDSYALNLTDRSYFHDTTRVPLYDRRHELSLADQGIISPFFVPQHDRRDELSLADLGIISPSSVPQYDRRNELALADLDIVSPSFVPQYDRRNELSVIDQGIISPSFKPQYDRRDEWSVVDRGIISPSLAQEGVGVGMPHLPEVGLGGVGVGMPHLPEVGLGGVGVGMPRLPEVGLGGVGVGMPRLPEVGLGLGGDGVGMPRLPEVGLGGDGVGMPRLPEVGLGGVGVCMSRLPEVGLGGVGVPRLPEVGLGGDGVGMPRLPEVGLGGVGVCMPRLPEVGLGGVGVCMPRLPEADGGLAGMKVEGIGGAGVGVTHPPEATGLGGLGGVVPHLPEAGFGVGVPCPPNGGLAGMKVEGLGRLGGAPHPEVKVEGLGQGMPCQPEAIGGLMKVEGFREGVPIPPEATGSLAGMNDFQQDLDQIFDFDGGIDSALPSSGFWMNVKADLHDKSIDDLFRR